MAELEQLRKKNEELETALRVLKSSGIIADGSSGSGSSANVAAVGGNMNNFMSTRTTFNTPCMEKGMTFQEYEFNVKIWMVLIGLLVL